MRTLLITLLLTALALTQEATTVGDLFAARQKQDGHKVLLGGTIKSYSETAERTVFLLTDEGKMVSVFLPKKAGYKNGEKAIVTGTFYLEKKLGGKVMSNVIEATNIEPSQE